MSQSEIAAKKQLSTSAKASLMLVLVTLVWGTSFSMTRAWQLGSKDEAMKGLLSALTLIALRMLLALLLVTLCLRHLVRRPTRIEHTGGFLLGSIFFAGFALQTWGLAYTTPSLSAFFTSLCSVWVPGLAWILFRERVPAFTLLGLVVALLGCTVLVDGWKLNSGDWLTVGASVLFAGQVLVLDYLGKRMEPSHLTASFLATTGGWALLGAVTVAALGTGVGPWLQWTGGMLESPKTAISVMGLAIFPTFLGFHWMNTYQPLVPSTRASLIYLLEPVFTSLCSVALGFDIITVQLLMGGGLILGGNLLVDLPRWLNHAWKLNIERQVNVSAAPCEERSSTPFPPQERPSTNPTSSCHLP